MNHLAAVLAADDVKVDVLAESTLTLFIETTSIVLRHGRTGAPSADA